MSNVEKLKKKAAEFEQKKQFDRALESYVQIIEQTKGNEEKDVAIYNRVGDLNLPDALMQESVEQDVLKAGANQVEAVALERDKRAARFVNAR